jgi:hypothetical protein
VKSQTSKPKKPPVRFTFPFLILSVLFEFFEKEGRKKWFFWFDGLANPCALRSAAIG